jgi:hypothetical protein
MATWHEWLCSKGYHEWSGRPGDPDRICKHCGTPLEDHEDI